MKLDCRTQIMLMNNKKKVFKFKKRKFKKKKNQSKKLKLVNYN